MKKIYFVFMLFVSPFLLGQGALSSVEVVVLDDQHSPQTYDGVSFDSPLSLGFSLYSAHIRLGYGFSEEVYTNSYLLLIDSLRDLSTYNIMDVLAFEIDKDTAITSYLTKLYSSLIETDLAIATLREEMDALNASMKDCLSQKSLADKQYSDIVKGSYEQSYLDESLANSKKYSQCASDARIDYNAKKIILNKLIAYRSVLETKYDYLSTNKEDLVVHYDIIKDDALDRLVEMRRFLEKHDL